MKSGKINDISKRFVLLSIDFVCKVVCVLINLCIDQGVFPDAFKSSPVTPVHKKAPQPISQTIVQCRSFVTNVFFIVLFSIGCRISLKEFGSYLVTMLVIGKTKILS